jgi:hypothetical protein
MDDWNFPTMAEIEEFRERAKKNGQAVRMMHDEGDTPEAGHVYTVSASFSMGDRSWVSGFWEILTINGPKAFVRIHTEFDTIERFEEIENRAWYLADDAFALRTKQEEG